MGYDAMRCDACRTCRSVTKNGAASRTLHRPDAVAGTSFPPAAADVTTAAEAVGTTQQPLRLPLSAKPSQSSRADSVKRSGGPLASFVDEINIRDTSGCYHRFATC